MPIALSLSCFGKYSSQSYAFHRNKQTFSIKKIIFFEKKLRFTPFLTEYRSKMDNFAAKMRVPCIFR